MNRFVMLLLIAAVGCSDDDEIAADLGVHDLAGTADLNNADLTPALISLALSAGGALAPGDGVDLVTTGTYAGAIMNDVSALATLHSSDSTIVSVAGAHASAVASGSAQITASLDGIDSAPVTITVKTIASFAVTAPDGSGTAIVSPGAAALQFKAIATFSDSTTESVSANPLNAWSSTATNIATVSSAGLAMPGDNIGVTSIGASYLGMTAHAQLQVQ